MTREQVDVTGFVGAAYHSIWVGDEEWTNDSEPVAAGMVSSTPTRNGIMLDTAVHTNLVQMTLRFLTSPQGLPADEWQDVAEASVFLGTNALFAIPIGGLGDVLKLPLPHTGNFSVRISGKGRYREESQEKLNESYLVEIWPSLDEVEVTSLRLTSPYGRKR